MKDQKNPKINKPTSEFTTWKSGHQKDMEQSVSEGKSCYAKGAKNAKAKK